MSRPRRFLLAAALLLAPVPLISGAGSPAGACSIASTSLFHAANKAYRPYQDIVLGGNGFQTVEGDLAADCTGATFTAMTGVEIVATWTSPSGETVDTLPATVDPETFQLEGVSFPVPEGAVSVSIVATVDGEVVTPEPLVIQIDPTQPDTTTTDSTTDTIEEPTGELPPFVAPEPRAASLVTAAPEYTG